MIKLISNNVDGYPSTEAEFEDSPTKEELVGILKQYHEQDVAEEAAQELIEGDEASIDDSSCTVYNLM